MVGWYIVSRDHDARARRSEIRELLKITRELLTKTEKDAFNYWTSAGKPDESRILAFDIKQNLNRLSHAANVLNRHSENFRVLDVMKQYRQAVTGGSFEGASRAALNRGDERLMDIAATAVEFDGRLELGFEAIYCSRGLRAIFRLTP